MSGILPSDISVYLDLVPSANQKPNFLAALSACVQPISDITAFLGTINADFDIDNAVGVQLDILGVIVGRTRALLLPVSGVFFSFDSATLGFDGGIWQAGSVTELYEIPDSQYRTVLRMKIANNQWDGSLPSAYTILNDLFSGTPFVPFIEDHGNKTLSIGLSGSPPDPLTFALLTQGFFDLRPAGMQIQGYITPSVPGPMFGFDLENTMFAGFDTGAWAIHTLP
ncbi:MAG: DUF2612 domain-containing protein [Nitrospirota bacterium]|nr:DUF2612 domain-containing protein [Nitrospirota bacterium]